MPALVRMRRTVGRLRSMPSRSCNSSVKWVWLAPWYRLGGWPTAPRRQPGQVGWRSVGGQLHHGVSLGRWDGVVGTTASVAVGQRGDSGFAVGGQQAAGMALAHAKQFGGLGDGHLEFQNGVEHGKSGLFFLIQRYVLHKKDIFADQLADDRIVEQRHEMITVFDDDFHGH